MMVQTNQLNVTNASRDVMMYDNYSMVTSHTNKKIARPQFYMIMYVNGGKYGKVHHKDRKSWHHGYRTSYQQHHVKRLEAKIIF